MFPIVPWRLFQKVIFNDRFYQFIYVVGNEHFRLKFIYQPNLGKCIMYNLNDDPAEYKPIKIRSKDLPHELKMYVREYNESRRRDIKFIIEKLKKGTLSPL